MRLHENHLPKRRVLDGPMIGIRGNPLGSTPFRRLFRIGAPTVELLGWQDVKAIHIRYDEERKRIAIEPADPLDAESFRCSNDAYRNRPSMTVDARRLCLLLKIKCPQDCRLLPAPDVGPRAYSFYYKVEG
jgi:hypothetical protein